MAIDLRRAYQATLESVFALDLRSGEHQWTAPIKGPISGVTVTAGVLWAAAGRALVALDVQTGELLARVRVPGSIAGGLAVALGRIYLVTTAGEVVAFG